MERAVEADEHPREKPQMFEYFFDTEGLTAETLELNIQKNEASHDALRHQWFSWTHSTHSISNQSSAGVVFAAVGCRPSLDSKPVTVELKSWTGLAPVSRLLLELLQVEGNCRSAGF